MTFDVAKNPTHVGAQRGETPIFKRKLNGQTSISHSCTDPTSRVPLDHNGLYMNNFDDGWDTSIAERARRALLDRAHSSKVARTGSSPVSPLRVLPTNLLIQVPSCLGNRSINKEEKCEKYEEESHFMPSLFSSVMPAREYAKRYLQLLQTGATHFRTPSPCGPSPHLPPTPIELGSHNSSEESQIDVWPGKHWHPEVYRMTRKAQAGLIAGKRPVLAEGCLSGSYIMRDPCSRLCAVFKPMDEEPSGPNNPKRSESLFGELTSPVKGRVTAGGGAVRECIAWLLDKENRAAVPPTSMATALSPFFRGEHEKHGSLQVYMRHECSAEDIGPSLFPLRDVQEIALLDIRLLNQDRHCGNILVSEARNMEECFPCAASDCTSSASITPCPLKVDSDGDEIMVEFGSSSTLLSVARTPPVFSTRLQVPTAPETIVSEKRRVASKSFDGTHRDESVGVRLIPIDHGFCLPYPRSMVDTDLAWLQWPQSHTPLAASQRSYIASLDPEQDIKLIQEVLGDLAPPQEYLMSIYIGTTLLQKGVEMGLSLYDIGCLMTRNGDPDEPSKLEWAVEMAAVNKNGVQQSSSLGVENCGTPFKQALGTTLDRIVREVCASKGLCKE